MSLAVNNHANNRRSSEYLGQLLNDKKQLQALPNVFLHVEKILDEEINRVRSSLLHWNTNKDTLRLPDPHGPVVVLSEKLFVPVNEYPDFNFVGRILGPRGMTAKQLELDTGCKIMVRGKGSMRDKVKEEQNRGKANWEHLNEDLHVLITVEDTQNRAEIKLRNAVEEVKKLLIPIAEGEDELKKMQLMELAIMNGTFHDAVPAQTLSRPPTITVVNTPQGPRMIATPSINVPTGLPVLQTTPTVLQQANAMTGTTPFIISPHHLQQLTGVSSSMATMLTGATPPGLVTSPAAAAAAVAAAAAASEPVAPANHAPAGVLYYSDPYLQRMFEYSGLEASAAGAVPKLRRTLTVREHPYTRGPLT